MQSQAQRASLNTFSSEMSVCKFEIRACIISKAAIIRSLQSVKPLSLDREGLSPIDKSTFLFFSSKTFIISSFNFLRKSASDVTLIDDCLFGNNLAKEVNAAQTIKEVAHEMSKKAPQLSSQQSRQPAT